MVLFMVFSFKCMNLYTVRLSISVHWFFNVLCIYGSCLVFLRGDQHGFHVFVAFREGCSSGAFRRVQEDTE